MTKLITFEQRIRRTLKAVKEIISKYENIEFTIEIDRDIYTKAEIGKKIIIKLRDKK